MISQSEVWYAVFPKRQRRKSGEVGKWLYFGDKEVLHAWLPKLDALVEAGSIMTVKLARKDPQRDPFPHKPCVLCVYTADDDKERERVKRLLAKEFGIEVSTWKSDAQTKQDWAEDGWLRLESQIVEIKRALARGDVPDGAANRQRLRDLTERLSELLSDPASETLAAELKLANTAAFVAELKRSFDSGEITLATILDHLDKLQTQVSRISDGRPTSPEPGRKVRNDHLFVVMPFGAGHVDTYDTIRRAILKADAELKVERIDERPGAFSITQEIWSAIESARMVVCDLTGERPNVYYELGYAHALRKPIVCVAKEGTTIHFDVSGFKVTYFRTYRQLETDLANEITGLLGSSGASNVVVSKLNSEQARP